MKVRAVVDQIESGKALLLIGPSQEQVFWALEHLPKEVKEGDILYMDINIAYEDTHDKKEAARQRIADLVRRTQEMDRQKDSEE